MRQLPVFLSCILLLFSHSEENSTGKVSTLCRPQPALTGSDAGSGLPTNGSRLPSLGPRVPRLTPFLSRDALLSLAPFISRVSLSFPVFHTATLGPA